MRILTTTVAGLVLFALAPSSEAQNSRAQIDADQPGVTTHTVHDRGPTADTQISDQDGGRHVPLPATRQTATPPGYDFDDLRRASVSPAPLTAEPRVDDGRDMPSLIVAVRRAENAFPEGRNIQHIVAAKTLVGPRTMTVDGRPLDARPGTPTPDETAPNMAELVPEADLEVGDELSEIVLGASFPNPVEGRARIAFSLPKAAMATVMLFDVRGRRVSTLFDGAAVAGTNEIALDASSLAAGTYVYVLDVNGERLSRRLQVAR
ncbi:MAG: T9SS type A sorting domain-containing protein [Bacteroidota bacterium]